MKSDLAVQTFPIARFALLVGVALLLFTLLPVRAGAITIVSLAGDKDNFGTGAPLGSPINSGIGSNGVSIHPDAADPPFDIWKTSAAATWIHSYTIPEGMSVVGATLTIATWDLEDGGAGDGSGGGPYDTALFLDGVEVPVAFDETFSPDVGPSSPNVTTFTLGASFLPLLGDGSLQVTLNPSGGERVDAISIDYAELRILLSHGEVVTLSGSDLLTYPGVSFLNGTPTLTGDSLVFGPNIRFAKLMVLPLTPPGSAPTTVMVSVNFTRLPCDLGTGSCAGGEVDFDPYVLLSDGAQMLGGSIGDNLNGNGGAQDVTDLGPVGSVNMATVIFENAGFPDIGEAVDAHFLFNLGSESTELGVSFNTSSGSYTFLKPLSVASGLSLVLMRDNELGEQIQLNSLRFLVSPTSVAIDIKPGDSPNSINLKSKGVVPVAILSSEDFNPVGVVVDTVKFAGALPEKFSYEDVNSDGVADLILHFRTQNLVELTSASTEATLTGELAAGGSITGTDSVRIVPASGNAENN